ncbi:proton-associated sugar transporter A-like [Acanthaster planci]|uniref:Proton-associated sugar transporter A-like n=1 Tax=Acanthaster planci TaxID=133434 RepID=A0A8B7YD31_ACAPL|nr:proton-associated sugar transporter A-like [Acanthaster planci]
MRTRTCSRSRTLSISSESSYIDVPSQVGHRIRNDSIQSRCSIPDLAILHAGEILQLPAVDSVDSDQPPRRPLWQLVLLNMVVLGIEFCYAVETALVTPLLLQMGLPQSLYSLTWIVSPTLGFFLNPVVGSLSDRCSCAWGRRRPFILILCIGMAVGFTVFLNGEDIGLLTGDTTTNHAIGLILTVTGVVILDFCADSCDSPSKAYIIDVCNLQDVDRGLNIRAVLGGLGSGIGYIFNSIDWESNALGQILGNQSRVVFVFTFVICTVCFTLTLFSVREKPLVPREVSSTSKLSQSGSSYQGLESGVPKPSPRKELSYDSLIQTDNSNPAIMSPLPDGVLVSKDAVSCSGSSSLTSSNPSQSSSSTQTQVLGNKDEQPKEEKVSVAKLLVSVVKMPRELRWLCLNHFLGWSGLLAIFLFYTDYIGEVVYKGDPTAPVGSESRNLFEAGIKMGSWGMVIFAASVIVSAVILDKLSAHISTRTAYVWGQTAFGVGTGCMAISSDSIYVTLALNATSGIMFATVTTLPFGIVADYHANYQTMRDSQRSQRGLGTDVACLSSVNFLAQIVVSAILGFIISAVGSKLAIVAFASSLAFLAALNSAIFVVYDLKKREQGSTNEHQPLIT